MVWDEKRQARWQIIRIVAFAFLVAAPLVYLTVMYLVSIPPQEGGHIEMMLYILLIVAIVEPATAMYIERFQITSYRANQPTNMNLDNLYFTLSIIKFAFVEVIYIFGLVVYFVSGNHNAMLYFYPIGIAWSFVYWPRQSKFEEFVRKIESSAL